MKCPVRAKELFHRYSYLSTLNNRTGKTGHFIKLPDVIPERLDYFPPLHSLNFLIKKKLPQLFAQPMKPPHHRTRGQREANQQTVPYSLCAIIKFKSKGVTDR
jgi:hypothetical protein